MHTVQAQTVYEVNSTADVGDANGADGVCDTGTTIGGEAECTFRAALEQANEDPVDEDEIIDFANIPVTNGVARITLLDTNGELEANSQGIEIRGDTAPGWSQSGPPVVYVDAINLSSVSDDALQVSTEADSSSIVGLGIVNAPDDGINLLGEINAFTDDYDPLQTVSIQFCWVGVEPDGSAAPNGRQTQLLASNPPAGIELLNAQRIVIGAPRDLVGTNFYNLRYQDVGRNVISGNGTASTQQLASGIIIRNQVNTPPSPSGARSISYASEDNIIAGNYIGLAPDGTTPLGNLRYGIVADDRNRDDDDRRLSSETLEIERNAIAANGEGGLLLWAENARVQSNTFGTTASGTQTSAALAPGSAGITIQNRFILPNNTIGDPDRSAGNANVIGGYNIGVQVGTSTADADRETIAGNYLGVTANGDDIGLGEAAVYTSTSDTTQIENNVIGNVGAGGKSDGGIVILGTGLRTQITGNVIGVTPGGDAAPIDGSGIYLTEGREIQVADNVIGNATRHGIWGSQDLLSDVQIRSNTIGETASGTPIGNDGYGIYISDGATDIVVGEGYFETDLGGSTNGNTVAHNASGGVAVASSLTTGVSIRGNTIVDNQGPPIDLGANGVTANDGSNGDNDDGPNELLNFPEITSVDCQRGATGDDLTLEYVVRTASTNASYDLKVDVYTASASQSGAAEFLVTDIYTTPFSTQTVQASGVGLCDQVAVATATDSDGNTSEASSPGQPLPVELAALNAAVLDAAGETSGPTGRRDVRLTWTTASETNNAGFTVEHRGPDADTWRGSGFVDGAGTTDEMQRYRFTVRDLGVGLHRFRLRQQDVDGTASLSREVTAEVTLAGTHALIVGPNPVRRQARVSLALPEAQSVQVELYDLLGRRVQTVTDGRLERGANELSLQTRGLASGTYLLRVRGDQFVTTRRITVVR